MYFLTILISSFVNCQYPFTIFVIGWFYIFIDF